MGRQVKAKVSGEHPGGPSVVLTPETDADRAILRHPVVRLKSHYLSLGADCEPQGVQIFLGFGGVRL